MVVNHVTTCSVQGEKTILIGVVYCPVGVWELMSPSEGAFFFFQSVEQPMTAMSGTDSRMVSLNWSV